MVPGIRFIALCLAWLVVAPAWSQQAEEGTAPEPGEPTAQAEPLPKAQNIDLEDPVPEADLLPAAAPAADAAPPEPEQEAADSSVEPRSAPPEAAEPARQPQPDETAVAPTPATEPGEAKQAAKAEQAAETVAPLVILGSEVPPGTSTRLSWVPAQSFEGVYAATPVLIVHGTRPGPVLCLTAAVHGDELNGIETVRRVLYSLDPEGLAGTVIGVPIVNLQGFHRSSRYLADRRDLNRYFPGDPQGSLASRIAASFFKEVVTHCDTLVDLHTGSYHRTNLPQLRADLHQPEVLALSRGFGATVVLHSDGAPGTLRRAATEAGVPAVTLEAGSSTLLDERSVHHSYQAIQSLLHHLEMVSKFNLWGQPEPVFYKSTWQRAPVGGVIFSRVKLGATVAEGDLLGTITNPITNVRTELHSLYTGRILGMALNQFVQPGFAAYHIGIQAPPEELGTDKDGAVVTAPSTDNDVEDVGANNHELPEDDPVESPLED